MSSYVTSTDVADATTATVTAPLPPTGTLKFLQVYAITSTSARPMWTHVRVRRNAVPILELLTGWVRGLGLIGSADNVLWQGSMKLEPQFDLQWEVRNDTGSTQGVGLAWLVEP